MRLLLLAPPLLPHPQGVQKALQKLGYNVLLFTCNEFYSDCKYLQRKLYKLGYTSLKHQYEEAQCKRLRICYEDFNPDLLLALSGLYIDNLLLDYLTSLKIPRFLWLWDGIERFPGLERLIPHFSHIFCFEKADVLYIQEKYSRPTSYCPLGYDEDAFSFIKTKKDIDICFIGNPNPQRVLLLDKVGEYCHQENLKLFVAGLWYDKKYFWKKFQYSHKHPYLFPYLINHYINNIVVAKIYRHSKICLNLGEIEHVCLNPRTFEILATGSFQLTDHIYKKGIDDGILRADSMISFLNEYDLIEKIKYYLSHEKLRQEIAQKGYKDAIPHTSIRSFVQSRICPEMDNF